MVINIVAYRTPSSLIAVKREIARIERRISRLVYVRGLNVALVLVELAYLLSAFGRWVYSKNEFGALIFVALLLYNAIRFAILKYEESLDKRKKRLQETPEAEG